MSALRASDNRVMRIVRRAPSNADELFWNPENGEFDPQALEGMDAVVNLCGTNIGEKRWSGAYKQQLRDSRITPTEVLATAVVEAGVGVLVNASAVGYYGDTRDRVVPRPRRRARVSSRGCAWIGRRRRCPAAGRRACGAGAHGAGAVALGRDVEPAPAIVFRGLGCAPGQRPPVHAVDQS